MLEVKNIRAGYGKGEVLRGISIELELGKIVAILGANGAGKTTLLRIISGLMKPLTGEIFFEGKRIDKLLPHNIVRLGISHIPEGRKLHLPMTVRQNLALGSYLRKNKAEVSSDLENLYKQFPILKMRNNQTAGSLSGGEQQMLAIARSLMSIPKLLLMDEPSLGLSPLMVKTVAAIIRDIRQAGISIILVEQNARMALKISDKAYILQLGTIVAQGNSSELAKDTVLREAFLGGY